MICSLVLRPQFGSKTFMTLVTFITCSPDSLNLGLCGVNVTGSAGLVAAAYPPRGASWVWTLGSAGSDAGIGALPPGDRRLLRMGACIVPSLLLLPSFCVICTVAVLLLDWFLALFAGSFMYCTCGTFTLCRSHNQWSRTSSGSTSGQRLSMACVMSERKDEMTALISSGDGRVGT